MQIDALLSESWEIYRRFFSRFVIIAAVVFVGVQLISTLLLSANDGSGFRASAQIDPLPSYLCPLATDDSPLAQGCAGG